MRDEVAYLFIQKNKVLLEYRKTESGKYDDLIIPRGLVEKEDKGKSHVISKEEHAVHREIYKMFDATIIPLQYELIDTIVDAEKEIAISVYFIYSWDGDHPLYMKEKNERVGRIRWFTINEALEAVSHAVDLTILKWAKEAIRVKGVLHGRLYK